MILLCEKEFGALGKFSVKVLQNVKKTTNIATLVKMVSDAQLDLPAVTRNGNVSELLAGKVVFE